MLNFKDSVISAGLHALEILVCMGIAYLALAIFNVDEGTKTVITGGVMTLLVKFLRTYEGFPISDYVNDR